MFPLASVATSPGRLSSPLPVPPGTPHVKSNVPQLHSPQLPPQPSSPHAWPVQFGVQHIPNFTAAAVAHIRLRQLWLVRQVRPSGLQPPASASRCPQRQYDGGEEERPCDMLHHAPPGAQASPCPP